MRADRTSNDQPWCRRVFVSARSNFFRSAFRSPARSASSLARVLSDSGRFAGGRFFFGTPEQ